MLAEGQLAFVTSVCLCTCWCGPARGQKIAVFDTCVVVRVRVARVVRVLEVVVLTLVHALRWLEKP